MCAPFSNNEDSAEPGGSPEEARARRAKLARKWAYLISTTAYLPLQHTEVERQLLELVDRLFDSVLSEPFESAPAGEAGTRLVELQCVGRDSIRRSVEVLGKAMLREPELSRADNLADRIVLVLGEMTADYSETLRLVTQQRQELLNQSLLNVARDSRRKLKISRAQFDEIFSRTTSGVALTELDGRLLRANPALAKTLRRSTAELAELTLFDLVHAEDVDDLRDAYQELLADQTRLRQTCRLLAQDGETMWASFTATLVRDEEGEPHHFVTIIDDDTEVSLLQRRLSHQSLHDALTGLPNRQFFSTRLENALRHADPATGITLYHLDLDGFSLVTDGLGHDVGDRLLKTVAGRLQSIFAPENAIVARVGGDEFCVLVVNTPGTPDVVTTVRRIHQELSAPIYVNGHRGVAASASIGVVHRPARDTDPAELLRAADMTLRRARRNGHRQWQLFDAAQDLRDRKAFSLAATMPGAWETGEIRVVYQPMVRLGDERVIGIEALLQWDHPELGPLPHGRCLKVADETGLSLPLGNWFVRSACEEMRGWQTRSGQDLPLALGLTPNLAADPDLVGGIQRTLDETGLSPEWLRPGFPIQALLTDHGEAVDNVRVLADIGIESEVHGYGATGDVECLEDLPVQAVRVARRLVQRQTERAGEDSLVARSLTNLIEIAHLAGVDVIVDGIRTGRQASWWRAAGGDVGAGRHFRPAPGGLPAPAARN
ncbi:putative bifunctional diguanylate cyclase/phosphodiesterase [Amycolatopsis sp.]|jgi:diguanylate cyclase (GGDEF)-like protein/PAS domain S-box-containing protein|uniref:putative bifunctional diguanylate cyclase/phosphodiesterase n=1 Tax=Amycolatopsis sp. TaxID=37632 RepID=UPI002E0572E7|nr:EAL domain-containing protein [Amycolatopsis sp.]